MVSLRQRGGAGIDIEDLLAWAYRDMKIDRYAGDDTGGTEREYILRSWASTWGRVEEYAALGTFVDTSFRAPSSSSTADEDSDAMVVHQAVLTLDAEACVLAIIHARANTRPGFWSRPAPRLVPVVKANGKPEMISHNNRPVACVIRWTHDLDRWEWDKQQYRVWRAALDVLADELAGKLKGFQVAPARADRAPWTAVRRAGDDAD